MFSHFPDITRNATIMGEMNGKESLLFSMLTNSYKNGNNF